MSGRVVEQFLEDSRDGSCSASPRPTWTRPSTRLAREAASEVIARGDASAFHVLMALRSAAPETFEALPTDTRAAVPSTRWAAESQFNDWGYLQPGGGHDGAAAAALLEAGESAIDLLRPLLDDDAEGADDGA